MSELVAHHCTAAHFATESGFVEHRPDPHRVGAGHTFLTFQPDRDSAFEFVLLWNPDTGEHHGPDVSLCLEEPEDEFRLVGTELGYLFFEADIDGEPGGDRPSVTLPPAAP